MRGNRQFDGNGYTMGNLGVMGWRCQHYVPMNQLSYDRNANYQT